MRRLLPLLLLFTLACTLFAPRATPTIPASPSPEATAVPSATPPSATPTSANTPAPVIISSPTPSGPFHLKPSDVTFHPDPQLYSGDIVSLELDAANADPTWEDASASLFVDSLDTEPLATANFAPFGIGGRAQATFQWVWNTAGRVGPQTVILTIVEKDAEAGEPPLEVLTLTVNLLPADARPMPEPLARWTQTESECCVFHYLTGTAAERDIAAITLTADEAFEQVEEQLGVTRQNKVVFTLLSRLLGHGGFASDEISVTYIDRDPAHSGLINVFKHEGTHILDRQIARERPTLMTEGLAVYVAGGHFKPEDLEKRAAALLILEDYIPLTELADDFYNSQHEIGYLEAGAFIKFLVDNFGWEKFKAFYASFQSAPSDSAVLDAALRANFNQSLAELEAQWLARLSALPPDMAQLEDLRLTVMLYDTLRRYQQLNDPAAYFLTAWLPNGPEARQRGIVADFVRHPTAPENIALETMLAAAGEAIVAQKSDDAETLLLSVNAVLDSNNLFFDPLAAEYLQIVTTLSADGYEAQSIRLDENTATATAIRAWPATESLTLTRDLTGWQLAGD
jgi:hypothetical protein